MFPKPNTTSYSFYSYLLYFFIARVSNFCNIFVTFWNYKEFQRAYADERIHNDISEASVGRSELAAKAGASPKDPGRSPQFAHRAVANNRSRRVGNVACLCVYLITQIVPCIYSTVISDSISKKPTLFCSDMTVIFTASYLLWCTTKVSPSKPVQENDNKYSPP